VSDGLRAHLVVPRLVAVDLAEPVGGAACGQPRRGIGGPDVDRVPRHVRRSRTGGHPSGSLRFRAVLGDRVSAKLILVRGGAPAAVDNELDAVGCGIGCGPAQGSEEGWIELGHARNRVVEDRRAGGDGTVSLARRTTVLTARGADRWCSPRRRRRRRGRARSRRRQRLGPEGHGDRREGGQQADPADPANPDPTGRSSCWCAGGHASIKGSAALPARMRCSIRRRYAPAR
jgi:hypothetical protein